MTSYGDVRRLAAAVEARRGDLRLSQTELSVRYGPSPGTIQDIEAASEKSYRAKSLRDLEDSLDWERGSVQRVLAGGDPIVKPPPAPRPIIIPIPSSIPEKDQQRARDAIERAAADLIAAYIRDNRTDQESS